MIVVFQAFGGPLLRSGGLKNLTVGNGFDSVDGVRFDSVAGEWLHGLGGEGFLIRSEGNFSLTFYEGESFGFLVVGLE